MTKASLIFQVPRLNGSDGPKKLDNTEITPVFVLEKSSTYLTQRFRAADHHIITFDVPENLGMKARPEKNFYKFRDEAKSHISSSVKISDVAAPETVVYRDSPVMCSFRVDDKIKIGMSPYSRVESRMNLAPYVSRYDVIGNTLGYVHRVIFDIPDVYSKSFSATVSRIIQKSRPSDVSFTFL